MPDPTGSLQCKQLNVFLIKEVGLCSTKKTV
jgi:hypothetical protein